MAQGTDGVRSASADFSDPTWAAAPERQRRRRRVRRRRSRIPSFGVGLLATLVFCALCIAAYYVGQASDEPMGTGVRGYD
jgi:hypothetical protein